MIKSHSNYCQLLWMFCSSQSNSLINKVHERRPKLTYRAKTKDFQQIRRDQNKIANHQQNLQVLMTEVYKIVNGIVPSAMNYLFQFCCNTNSSKHFQEIFTESRKTVKYGKETVAYRVLFLCLRVYTQNL